MSAKCKVKHISMACLMDNIRRAEQQFYKEDISMALPGSSLTDVVSAISGSLAALATLCGVAVAWFGLSTWRKQLKGTTEYDLAKRVLLEVYKIRDAVEYVRQPFLMSSEAGDDSGNLPWEVAAYNNRWKEVRRITIDLDAVCLEGEVIWGESIVTHKRALFSQINKLHNAVHSFTTAKMEPIFKDDFTEDMKKTLYAGSDGMGADKYAKELAGIIKKFEDYVKPHLKRE